MDGVSFAIAEGETYSLVGETGCGKSTIAKMILSILRPTDGEIFLILGQRFRQVFPMQLIENTQIVMGFSIVGLQRDGSLVGSLRLIKPIQLGIDHT